MAAYATHTDIESLVAGRAYTFGAATKPTDTQVDAYCDQITAELNGVLEQAGYVVPVVGTDPLAVLKLYCCYGVIPLVEMSRTPDELKGDEKNLGDIYRGWYEAALKAISAKKLNAPFSTTATGGGFGDYWSANPDDTDAVDAWFKREDKF
jgi:hypothetical protein